jgi:Zn-finger nucleic acid-binding protein
MTHFVKCPSCKNELREKGAGSMTVDVCYGGCGGIWFDRSELERVDARSASTLHTIWRDPNKPVLRTGPRSCPRCPNQVLQREWFSDLKQVEIDRCPTCGGIWLDEGEFSRIHQEIKGAKVAPPGWAAAIAAAAAQIRP